MCQTHSGCFSCIKEANTLVIVVSDTQGHWSKWPKVTQLMNGLARVNPLPPEPVLLTARLFCQGKGPLKCPGTAFLQLLVKCTYSREGLQACLVHSLGMNPFIRSFSQRELAVGLRMTPGLLEMKRGERSLKRGLGGQGRGDRGPWRHAKVMGRKGGMVRPPSSTETTPGK